MRVALLELGKTFKGMTDELLEWQTRELLARETHRAGHIVYVRPELVVEIAFMTRCGRSCPIRVTPHS